MHAAEKNEDGTRKDDLKRKKNNKRNRQKHTTCMNIEIKRKKKQTKKNELNETSKTHTFKVNGKQMQ